MIWLIATYLLFTLGFEHWAGNGVTDKIIYYTFQYVWMAVLSLYSARKYKHISLYLFAIIFAAMGLNELLCLSVDGADYQEWVNPDTPVYGMTILAGALFTIYEIIQWRKRRSALRGRI